MTKYVRDVPSHLKTKIAQRCAEKGESMNDLVVGILAEKFGVRFEKTGRGGGDDVGAASDVVLRMPPALSRKIDVAAARAGETRRDVILGVLASEL